MNEEKKEIHSQEESERKQRYHTFSRLSLTQCTEEETFKAVQEDPLCIRIAPRTTLSERVIREACQHNPHTFAFIDPRWLTEEMYLWGVDANPDAWFTIPNENKTPAIYKKVIENKPELYREFPQEIRYDWEIAIKALKGNKENIHYVPIPALTREFFLETAPANPYVICAIPPEMRTHELYKQLLRQDETGLALNMIPEELKTKELCQIAIDRSFQIKPDQIYNYLLSVPYPDLIAKVLDQIEKPYKVNIILYNLGPKRQSPEIAEVALRKCPNSIQYLAGRFCTPEICQKVLKEDPALFCTISSEKRNPELSLFAVLLDKRLTSYVPKSIENGENIYTYGMSLIKKEKRSFTFDEIKERYNALKESPKESMNFSSRKERESIHRSRRQKF